MNENLENQSGGIKRNPSRNNTNVNQGQNDEKSFNPETNVDSGGIPDATGTPDIKQSLGEKSEANIQDSEQQSGEGLSGSPDQAGAVPGSD